MREKIIFELFERSIVNTNTKVKPENILAFSKDNNVLKYSIKVSHKETLKKALWSLKGEDTV